MNAQEPWHLDRKVPIALIVTIIVQTAGIVWWAANVDTRLAVIEKTDAAQGGYADRLTRLESAKEDVSRRLDRIEVKIDRILETWSTRTAKD